MTTFTSGTTYITGRFGQAVPFTVVSRTAKTIKVQAEWDNEVQVKTFRPAVHDGVEFIKPYGSFAACPIMKANRAI